MGNVMKKNISFVSIFLIIGLSMLFRPVMLCGGPAPGAGTPGQMVKKEFNPQVMRALDEFRQKDVAKIKRVKWNSERTRIKTLSGRPLSLPFSGTPEDAAKHFLSDNAALFRLDPELKDIQLDVERTRESSVGYYLRFKQTFGVLPVFQGGFDICLKKDDKSINLIHSYYLPLLDISHTPVLSEDECIEMAKDYFVQNYRFRVETGGLQSLEGKESIQWKEPLIKLGIFEHKGKPYLVYKVILQYEDPLAFEEYMIDANTGNVLRRRSLSQHN